MKQLIVILFLSFTALSQTHEIPFPDSNAVWVQAKSKLYPPGDGPDEYCPFIIYSYGQSIVNGESYNDVYASPHNQGVDYLFQWVWEGETFHEQIGRFRTDSLKVYYQKVPHGPMGCWLSPAYDGYSYDPNDEYAEFVMYDFGLQVGDTFDLTTEYQVVLDSIDSVFIEGTYYRRFNFNQVTWFAPIEYYWIEGIGSSFGFFGFFYGFEQGLGFYCFHEDPDTNTVWYYPFFSYAHSNPGCKFVGLPEIETDSPKEIVRIVDLLGRESNDIPNTTLIFIYSDGSKQKVFRVE